MQLQCNHCKGKGRKSELCVKCLGKGTKTSANSWYACSCSNHRCVKCGGTGVDPRTTTADGPFPT